MSVLSTLKDGGLGTVKNFFGDGWKGIKFGLMLAAGLGVVGALASGAGLAIVLAGVGLAATPYTAGIAAAFGGVTGGYREVSKVSRKKTEAEQAAVVNANHRLEGAVQQRAELTGPKPSGRPGPANHKNYQFEDNGMHNGKSANHFQNMHGKGQTQPQLQPQAGTGQGR